jgi:type IV secretory pathway VirJ component
MAPRRYVEWVVRPNSWWNAPGRGAYPFEPTLRPLGRWPVLCLHGRKDSIASCPDLAPHLAHRFTLPGGHRMDMNFERAAELIIASPGRKPAGAPAAGR